MLSKQELVEKINDISSTLDDVKTAITETQEELIEGGKASKMFDTVLPVLSTAQETMSDYADGIAEGADEEA